MSDGGMPEQEREIRVGDTDGLLLCLMREHA